jgi:hypothetical protein
MSGGESGVGGCDSENIGTKLDREDGKMTAYIVGVGTWDKRRM